ncbi:hypothetical protein [Mucilaginibacter antarcticus]|uniref:hypothetical protein n=1 Tax=Mucilaginibacter antarcticus TaxID=1855725 RepID=UPI00362656F9
MANLVIDIGNTFIKAAIFEDDDLVFTDQYPLLDNQIIAGVFNSHTIDKAMVSSVKKQGSEWETTLSQKQSLFILTLRWLKV